MTHVIAVVVRLLGLLLASWGTVWLLDLGMSDAEVGVNIGAGLMAFAVTALLSLVWALLDGHRAPRSGSGGRAAEAGRPARGASLAARVAWWVAVAVLLGLSAPLQAQGVTRPVDTDVFASDLRTLTPFHIGLVAVPAVVGLGAGALTRRRTRG